MQLETVPIDSIQPAPTNRKKHSARNIGIVKDSLTRFGQQSLVVVGGDNLIYKGCGTWQAAKELGWPDIKIHRTHLTGAEARAYSAIDNRSGEIAVGSEWDIDGLLDDLTDPDIGNIGFTDEEIESLTSGVDEAIRGLTAEPSGPVVVPDPPAADLPSQERPARGNLLRLTDDEAAALDEACQWFHETYRADLNGGPKPLPVATILLAFAQLRSMT
jgi:hypothetical protein